MTVARLAGRVAGVPRARGLLPGSQGRLGAGQGGCGSVSMRCHAAVMAPAHGQVAWILRWRRRPPRTSRAAACSTRYRSVFRLGFGQVAVQGQQFQPGEQDLPGHRGGQPGGVDREVMGGEVAQAGVLAGADGVLDPCVNAVGGVDVGSLAHPALGVRGPAGDPQGVPPAVCGLEQGELRAGMRPLAAGEDPHSGGPARPAGRRAARGGAARSAPSRGLLRSSRPGARSTGPGRRRRHGARGPHRGHRWRSATASSGTSRSAARSRSPSTQPTE